MGILISRNEIEITVMRILLLDKKYYLNGIGVHWSLFYFNSLFHILDAYEIVKVDACVKKSSNLNKLFFIKLFFCFTKIEMEGEIFFFIVHGIVF